MGKGVSDQVAESVLNFYENKEYLRMCPEKKKSVVVKINDRKEQKQKRLLLLNLRELHIQYNENKNNRIGFSKFL